MITTTDTIIGEPFVWPIPSGYGPTYPTARCSCGRCPYCGHYEPYPRPWYFRPWFTPYYDTNPFSLVTVTN